MELLQRLYRGLIVPASRRRQEIEAEVLEELHFHIEMRTTDNVLVGMSPTDARAAAREAFGDIDRIRRLCVSISDRHPWRDSLESVRSTALLGLIFAGLIGLFMLADAALLLPIASRYDPELVSIWSVGEGGDLGGSSIPDFIDWRGESSALAEMTLYSYELSRLDLPAGAARLRAARVSPDFFAVFRARTVFGHSFAARADTAPEAVILSHDLWTERFGADPHLVGRTVRIDGEPVAVLDIMPKGFDLPLETSLYLPLDLEREDRGRNWRAYTVVGRLRSDATIDDADAEIGEISRRLEARYPETNTEVGAAVLPFGARLGESLEPLIRILAFVVAAALVLVLISVTQARVSSPAPERPRASVWAAGLKRGALLSASGVALGLALAHLGVAPLVERTADTASPLFSFELDTRVLSFAAALVVVTAAILAGPEIASAFRGRERGTGPTYIGATIQLALATLLIVFAVVAVRSHRAIAGASPGFEPKNLLSARLELPEADYETPRARSLFLAELLKRLEQVPEVELTSLTWSLPLGVPHHPHYSYEIVGHAPPPTGHYWTADVIAVGSDYFDVLGIPMVAGDGFKPAISKGRPVIVVSQALAEHHWGTASPIGEQLLIGGGTVPFTIVGVAGDVRARRLDLPPVPTIYGLYWQSPSAATTLVLRTASRAEDLIPAVRQVVADSDPRLALTEVASGQQVVRRSVAAQSNLTKLIVAVAALALAIALQSLYRTVMENARANSSELAIRLALGARRRQLLKLVLERPLLALGVGTVLGLGVAWITWPAVSALLPAPVDLAPSSHLLGGSLLVGFGVLASLVAALRAVRLRPAQFQFSETPELNEL